MKIVLSAALEPNGQVAVLVHELAHVHGARYQEFGRAGAEVVAETAAFVALSAASLDTAGQSVPYVSGWADAALRRWPPMRTRSTASAGSWRTLSVSRSSL